MFEAERKTGCLSSPPPAGVSPAAAWLPSFAAVWILDAGPGFWCLVATARQPRWQAPVLQASGRPVLRASGPLSAKLETCA